MAVHKGHLRRPGGPRVSDQWPSINLNYFFWLPAGKDEFGFAGVAPLTPTAYYRKRLERTISTHFTQQVDALRDPASNKLGFMDLTSPRVIDGELGLRKVHFSFAYQPDHESLRPILREGPINGTAMIFSNGLYLWTFRIVYRPGTPEAELHDILQRFLIEDFVERHIRHIFHFAWNSATAEGSAADYRGILTYYQLELLFNGVFDNGGHPHLYLGDTPAGPVDNGSDAALGSYAVQTLIKSLSLCGLGHDYFPLFDRRKEYSLRGSHWEDRPYIDSSADLGPEHVDGDEQQYAREIFLSRLTFAGMEHFLRVSISYGLIHYKNGLDHIRSELVNQGMEARKNRPSGELRRPSLSARPLTVADLEAHHTLLAGKVPMLAFLRDLVDGATEVSRPLREVKLNGRPGAAEWNYARSTLDEARAEFARQLFVIQADVSAIESSLTAVRAETMLQELTEARKLSEIAAESARSSALAPRGTVELKAGQLERQLAVPLTVFALIIGGIEVCSGLLFFATDRLFADAPILQAGFGWQHITLLGLWGVGLVIFLAALRYGWNFYRRAVQARDQAAPDAAAVPERQETHVFDYASLLREIYGQSESIMVNLGRAMIDIEAPRGEKVRCVNYSTFRETPTSGIERIKYSLESPESSLGMSYVLHVEVDRRLSGAQGERLRDIRLVVRHPPQAGVAVVQAAAHIIASCLQALVFPGENQGEVRRYMRERLGLEWDSAAELTDPQR